MRSGFETRLIRQFFGEMVAWKGSGQGKFGQGGAVKYRGILYFQTGVAKDGATERRAGCL